MVRSYHCRCGTDVCVFLAECFDVSQTESGRMNRSSEAFVDPVSLVGIVSMDNGRDVLDGLLIRSIFLNPGEKKTPTVLIHCESMVSL